MQRSSTTPDQFIQSLPEASQDAISKLDKLIGKEMQGEERVLWEGVFWGGSEQNIIGYGEYNYQRSDKELVEWFMVGLAQQKNYITVFVNAVDDKQYLAEKYADKLGKVKVGKSSISFKKLEDIDLPALTQVVREAKKSIKG